MNTNGMKWLRVAGIVVVCLVVVAVVGLIMAAVWGPGKSSGTAEQTRRTPAAVETVELVPGQPYTLRIPDDVKKALNIGPPAVVETATHARPLVLPGSTALDPSSMARVRTRFNAEVVEIAKVPDEPSPNGATETAFREIRTGDKVKKGDPLAVVWSVDVGSKKSDLVDALVQLRLDEQRLKTREELARNGSIPEDTLNQTRRDVVSDRNAVDRAERTLRVWNIPDKEIQVVKDEAEQAFQRQGKRDKEKEKLWARSELVAPRDGTIVERNVSVGEFVVDNTVNLFTIADVDRIMVLASPPEDVLPTLLGLKSAERRWTLQTIGAPPVEGRIDEISYILDPNQHTAVVKGHINNPEGRLRAGQFVTATIHLEPPPDVAEVPLNALAEDGKQSFVFVQADPEKPYYTMRRVQVTLRFEKTAFVLSRLAPGEEKLTPDEAAQGLQPRQPLKPGDRILTSGVLELRAALEDKLSKAGKGREGQQAKTNPSR
jgi:cobalt-zinc-cadmium efflux system membrane fusion protein